MNQSCMRMRIHCRMQAFSLWHHNHCLKATYMSCTYTIFGPVIVSLHVIFVVPPGPPWRNSCHFIFSTRAASNHLATDCNMSGTYGEPDWATVTSGKADATADAGPTTTSAAAAAASTPSPS